MGGVSCANAVAAIDNPTAVHNNVAFTWTSSWLHRFLNVRSHVFAYESSSTGGQGERVAAEGDFSERATVCVVKDLPGRMMCGSLGLRCTFLMANPSSHSPNGSELPKPNGSGYWRFGLFELDVVTGELRRSGRRVHLAPQPGRVLLTLVERAGQIVTRDELKEAAWGDKTFVDFEQGLNFCMKQIRAALGDEADNPRFIETVPRRGYRLIVPVERVVDPSPPVPVADVPAPAEQRPPHDRLGRWVPYAIAGALLVIVAAGGFALWRSARQAAVSDTRAMIAVLPFDNLSGDPGQDYFSEGFTEELIGQLGRIDPSRLGVIARTSTLGYKRPSRNAAQIGRELHVQHLVEGTVRRSGNRVRINAQLIRVSDQSNVWAEVYDGEVRDILSLQHEVAIAIARQIVASIGPSNGITARVVDPEVYDLYLRGRYFWNRRTGDQVERAIAIFTEAVRRDPEFAPAHAGLADSLLVGSRAAALSAADRALSLDPRLAEAHTARANALMHMLQWAPAEESYRRAIDLDPSYVPARYFYSEYLFSRSRCPEAREQALKGMQLDPLSAIATHAVGVTLYYCRAYDEALPYLRRGLELDPQHTWAHFRIGLVLEQLRAYDQALTELAQTHIPLLSAYTYAAWGRPTEARRILRETIAAGDDDTNAYQIALAYAGLGEREEALKWLTRVVRRQLYQAPYIKAEPRLDALQMQPQFQALLHEAGLE